MKLLNDTTTERTRSSDGCTVLECGCAHTDAKWVQMCEAHYLDWYDRHHTAQTARGVSPGEKP